MNATNEDVKGHLTSLIPIKTDTNETILPIRERIGMMTKEMIIKDMKMIKIKIKIKIKTLKNLILKTIMIM